MFKNCKLKEYYLCFWEKRYRKNFFPPVEDEWKKSINHLKLKKRFKNLSMMVVIAGNPLVASGNAIAEAYDHTLLDM